MYTLKHNFVGSWVSLCGKLLAPRSILDRNQATSIHTHPHVHIRLKITRTVIIEVGPSYVDKATRF